MMFNRNPQLLQAHPRLLTMFTLIQKLCPRSRMVLLKNQKKPALKKHRRDISLKKLMEIMLTPMKIRFVLEK